MGEKEDATSSIPTLIHLLKERRLGQGRTLPGWRTQGTLKEEWGKSHSKAQLTGRGPEGTVYLFPEVALWGVGAEGEGERPGGTERQTLCMCTGLWVGD